MRFTEPMIRGVVAIKGVFNWHHFCFYVKMQQTGRIQIPFWHLENRHELLTFWILLLLSITSTLNSLSECVFHFCFLIWFSGDRYFFSNDFDEMSVKHITKELIKLFINLFCDKSSWDDDIYYKSKSNTMFHIKLF